MIKIRFLDNNKFLVRYNGEKRFFTNYITKILSNLSYCAEPVLSLSGGWIFDYSKLEEVISNFKEVEYENNYTPPVYSDMGKDMKLQPYDYQKEAIYFAINNLNTLMVLPCGSGKTVIAIGVYLEAKQRNIIKGQGLIVVKASLKAQWEKEVSKFSNYSAKVLQTYANRCSKWIKKIKQLEKQLISADDNDKENIKEKIKQLTIESENFFNEQFEEENDLLIANYETLLDDKVLNKLLSNKIECVMCDENFVPYISNNVSALGELLELSNIFYATT